MKGAKTGGRKAGTPNKVSVTVKDNVIQVFQEIGGTETLKGWAQENLTEFYKLYAKLIPSQVEMDAVIENRDIGEKPLTEAEWAVMINETSH